MLSVRTPMGGRLISDARVSVQTITLNGDGVNDVVRIEYDVRDIAALRPHVLQIFDLSGRVVRRLPATPAASGIFELMWNGHDDGGGLVAPGVYLYRIEIEVDLGSNVVTGLLSVAY